jgi:hypothetical protein
MSSEIRHAAKLPLGYRAVFTWEPPSPGAFGMSVAWTPTRPVIRSARHRRHFLEAYQAARREFLTMVATTLGGTVVVADASADLDEVTAIEAVIPAMKH